MAQKGSQSPLSAWSKVCDTFEAVSSKKLDSAVAERIALDIARKALLEPARPYKPASGALLPELVLNLKVGSDSR
jgi:hypothetical protein